MSNNKSIKFDNLLPKDDLNLQGEARFDAFKYAMEDPKIRNVGITGNYGSGKSSFLQSAIKTMKLEDKCLNVSLASFTFLGDDTSNTTQKTKKGANDTGVKKCDNLHELKNDGLFVNLSKEQLRNIEISILHQLIYKKSMKELPNSRLPRITGYTDNNARTIFLEVISFIVSLVLILEAVFYPVSIFFLKPYFIKFVRLFLFFIGCILIQKPFYKYNIWFYKKLLNISVKKVSFKNAEIELKSYESDSILNQRLDEILYFFEQTKYEYVIFEDLDRFNSNQIFVHLREINKIINENNQINRSVKFIYAVRDQMFKDEERVKFFDFIIPVIPLTNVLNSGAFLCEISQQEDKKELFSDMNEQFFRQIGLFINDMRLLKNIINEYILFKEKSSSKDNKKLFSLIVYKNLFPIDFAMMQKRTGYIASIFNCKNKFIEKKIIELNSEIETSLQNIEVCKKEYIANLKELRILYLSYYCNQKGPSSITVKDIIKQADDDNFDLIFSSKYINYSGNYTTVFDSEFFNELRLDNKTYEQRKTIVEDNEKKQIQLLMNKVEMLRKKTSDIKHMSFNMLYSTYKDDINLVLNKNLLHYNDPKFSFIRLGLIDEQYLEYLTIFHNGDLSQADNDYIMSVYAEKPLSYDYEITEIVEIIKKIEGYFIRNNPALFNFSLVNYLAENPDNYQEELKELSKYIMEEPELLFLKSYIISYPSSPFITYLYDNYENLWERFLSSYTEDFVNEKEFAIAIIRSLGNFGNYQENSNYALNINESFCKYLNENTDVLFGITRNDNIEEIFFILQGLGICFIDIENVINDKRIFSRIIEYDLFNYNLNNFHSIFEYYQIKNVCVYSSIYNTKNEKLIENVNKKISLFIEAVILKQDSVIEEEKQLISLLNNSEVPLDLRNTLILKVNVSVKIQHIQDIISKELWNSIFGHNIIDANWDNIISLFKLNNMELSEILINFIKDNSILVRKDESSKINKKELDELYFAILENDEISANDINKLNFIQELSINRLSEKSLSKEKIKLLIDKNIIDFSDDNITYLRKIDLNYSNCFIKNNIKKYLSHPEEYNITNTEILFIEKQKGLTFNEKKDLICFNIISLCNSNNKLEIISLIKKYGLYDYLELNQIQELLITTSDDFLSMESEKLKIDLISKCAKKFSSQGYIEAIENLNIQFSKIRNQKSVTIDFKTGYDLLAQGLVDLGIIKKYDFKETRKKKTIKLQK